MATSDYDIPKASVARAMTDSELADALDALRREGFELRFQRAAGKMTNSARIRLARRGAARAITERARRARLAAAGTPYTPPNTPPATKERS